MYFWSELLYVSILPLTKISILFFYLKIFPKRSIKIACWVLIGLNIGYLISFLVVSIIQCIPIPGAWLSWDGTYNATCHNVNMQGWVCTLHQRGFRELQTVFPRAQDLARMLVRLERVKNTAD